MVTLRISTRFLLGLEGMVIWISQCNHCGMYSVHSASGILLSAYVDHCTITLEVHVVSFLFHRWESTLKLPSYKGQNSNRDHLCSEPLLLTATHICFLRSQGYLVLSRAGPMGLPRDGAEGQHHWRSRSKCHSLDSTPEVKTIHNLSR